MTHWIDRAWCTVSHGSVRLTIGVATGPGGFGGPLKCYSRPKLGYKGVKR